ncbi:hypothetical protein E2562_021418, partial [Oryza meyeriana var. granulata]
VEKCCAEKASWATPPPSLSKRNHRRKRRWSSSNEVLAGGQDDRRPCRSEKQEGKQPRDYCLIHHMDAHDLVDCYVVKCLLEKDWKHCRDRDDDKDKDDEAAGLDFQQLEQIVAFIQGGSSSQTSL